QRRRMTYMGGLLVFLVVVGLGLVRKATNVEPTCFDNKKNGGEVGVDCGGSCLQYCPNELADPKLRWARSFEITPGIVHAVAYIEHSYPASSAREVKYLFKLYDEKNSLITERTGTTYLGPMGRTAIVETLIPTGNSTVATTRFFFLPPIPWEKTDEVFSQVVVKTDRNILENFSEGTRLTVTLENLSRYTFTNIDAVAILYDNNDNAITTSKILMPTLDALARQTIYFTWPYSIEKESVRSIEVVPRYNPFSATAL
ncbi:MAG: hypothetical protein AAB681_03010, partial [Patescibacteria group bacterium]